MWNKNQPNAAADESERSTPPRSSGAATIGPSISIKGDIRGEGDLVIEGRVEGGIRLEQHDVTVSSTGRVEADVHGRRICVEGEVKGDLFGEEIVIRKSGRVDGNAVAVRVTLDEGCQFRGSINMKSGSEKVVRAAAQQPPNALSRALRRVATPRPA